MTQFSFRSILPLVLVAAVGCKKQDEPAAAPLYQPGMPGAAGAAALPSATAAPIVNPAPSATPSAAPTAPDPALVAAVTPMLTQLAKAETVSGSKALGSPLVGTIGGAQTLEQPIMLQPNKCYSVVGVGMPPIVELNIQLLAITIIPGMAPVLATDQDTGASATLGKKPNCYKWALPLPVSVKVVVSSAGGQGVAAAQVFEK